MTDTQLKRGLLDIGVLAYLKSGEAHGYGIIKSLSPYFEISESTLYPILRRLETGGCLTVKSVEHNGRLRKIYSITQTGLDKIREFLDNWREVMLIYEFIDQRWNNE